MLSMPYKLDLREIQAPLKERYRADPASAHVVTEARTAASDLDDPRRRIRGRARPG